MSGHDRCLVALLISGVFGICILAHPLDAQAQGAANLQRMRTQMRQGEANAKQKQGPRQETAAQKQESRDNGDAHKTNQDARQANRFRPAIPAQDPNAAGQKGKAGSQPGQPGPAMTNQNVVNQQRPPQNPNQQKGAGPRQTADVKKQSRGFFNLRK
jgi:hypothetical protein